MPGPPVARMMSASFITVLVSSRLGTSIQPMMPSGAPAFTAASSTTFAAAMVHFFARGWGLMMMPLRVFSADQRLKDRGGGGVGGGDDRRDHADGLGNLLDAVGRILFDNAAGLGVLIGIVNIFGGVVVLDDLVFHYAHAGLLHSHFGQRDTLEVGGHSSGADRFPSTCSWV